MKTILVPLDFSDCLDSLVQMAETLARPLEAKLALLHVATPEPEFIGYGPGPQSVRDNVAKQLTEVHQRMHELETQLAKQGLSVTAVTVQGYPDEKIVSEAEKLEADLIIMGSHGHGALHNLLVGSVTEGVLRKAPCPVLVVPRRKDGQTPPA